MKIFISRPLNGSADDDHSDIMRVLDKLTESGHKPVFQEIWYEDTDEVIHITAWLTAYRLSSMCICKGWQLSKLCRNDYIIAKIVGMEMIFEDENERPKVDN